MSRRTEKNVGVIGLGIIGRRVAENLRRRGFPVFVWNRTPRPFPNFVGSPAEIAQLCDYIQIFVSDDDALLQVVQDLKQSLKAHHVVMAHSTVAPHTMRAAAEIVHRRGAQFLDAPFTGSKSPAEKGELVYYVGGDEAAFRRARPVLEASSKEIIEIGEIGQATLIKIATNIVTAATVQVAAEALALVRNAGLAPEKLVAAMRHNASNSATLSSKLPKMIKGDFDPHFSVKHMLKDVQIASRLARSHGLTLGATETVRDSLLEEARQERGDYDFSSLVRSYFPEVSPAEAAEETSDPEQHPTLDLKEGVPETREPEPEPEPVPDVPVERAKEEAVLISEQDEKPIEASPVVDVVASEGTVELEDQKSGRLEAAELEALLESGESEIRAERKENEQAPPEEELEPAIQSERAEKEGERRGFFSRMFGKNPDYEEPDY